MEEQCQIFKNELKRCYNRMPSQIRDHTLLRKPSGDDQKRMRQDGNKGICNSGI
jgi:hypothetical protein